ncbi:MAG: hypothetical protein NTY32_00560 [Bacteroidia bacterium]|nr:hypothetical protein [Bacteroidia bacterium]
MFLLYLRKSGAYLFAESVIDHVSIELTRHSNDKLTLFVGEGYLSGLIKPKLELEWL